MTSDRLFTTGEAAVLTRLSPAVLRKWEKRYGVVQPQRMSNGYRGYSEHDLAVLRWVASRIERGALTSTSMEEAKKRLRQGWNPLEEMPLAETSAPGGGILAQERQQLLGLLLNTDSVQAARTLDVLMGRFQVETVLLEILEPLLYEVGHLWAGRHISEYQESFSSTLIRDRLSALRAMLPPQNGPRLLTTCVPGEQHELGSLIFGLIATRQGFQVTNLGPSPSRDGLITAITHLRPHAVCMSVTTLERLREAAPALALIWERTRTVAPPPVLVLGGQGVRADSLPRGLDGYQLEQGRADHALQRLKDLLHERA